MFCFIQANNKSTTWTEVKTRAESIVLIASPWFPRIFKFIFAGRWFQWISVISFGDFQSDNLFFYPKGYGATCPDVQTRDKSIERILSPWFPRIFKLFLQEGDFLSISLSICDFQSDNLFCFNLWDMVSYYGVTFSDA